MKQVQVIARRFQSLNPYAPEKAKGSILKVESINVDEQERPRALHGLAISAKRYVLYEKRCDRISLIDAKAHGLGYLYPPCAERPGEHGWHWRAWDWLLRTILGIPVSAPSWFDAPAMMRIVVSTPIVLERLNRETRPFNSLFVPLIDGLIGYPRGVDPQRFTLIAPFSKHPDQWLDLPCINVHDGKRYQLALTQTAALDKVIPQTIGAVLRRYAHHAEAKSLAPTGERCDGETRGLLQRDTVIAQAFIPTGKEADRRWEQGEDLSLLESDHPVFGSQVRQLVKADRVLIDRIEAFGIRAIIRAGGPTQHTLEKVRAGVAVPRRTLARVLAALDGTAR